ncbi:MAG: hypothetical protein KA371_07990 [Acidobacteria bacterium]|nr:hypothetical protein [Acidobacteriota bacterium]
MFRLALATSLLALTTTVAAEQVTTADLQTLEDSAATVAADVAQARSRDAAQAGSLDGELDEVRDDIAYLRGKLRREGKVSQSEVADVRTRLDRIRMRAQAASRGLSTSAPSGGARELPVGTEVDVRLLSTLTTATAKVEDRIEATTVLNIDNQDHVLVPAGSVFRGTVTTVNRPGRIDRKGSLTLLFDQVTVRNETMKVRATVLQALESEGLKGDTAKIGAGAGVGAIIGGILGGFKGVLTGILVGGGGVIAATEGQDVTLPAGTILRVRLDTPLIVP